MKKYIIAGITCLSISTSAHAVGDLTELQTLGQNAFEAMSKDLGAAFSYKAVAPAEPLGITGFDIGIEFTGTKMENSAAWASATSDNSAISTLPLPRLHAHKGLPFNFDVGLSYVSIPSTEIKLTGYELRYAILEGGITMPALALRLTKSTLSGVDQLDLDTTGYELTVSKGFAFVTPYAGIGRVKTESVPKGTAAVGLTKESFTDSKTYLGVNINFGFSNFAIETDKTGDSTSYTLKYGFRW